MWLHSALVEWSYTTLFKQSLHRSFFLLSSSQFVTDMVTFGFKNTQMNMIPNTKLKSSEASK